jgi:hypothetical protein
MAGLFTRAGRPDSRRFQRVLEKSGVPIHRRDRRNHEIYITDLQERVPDLWQAIQAVHREHEEEVHEKGGR